MAIFKCKMCGEPLDLFKASNGICRCDLCNTTQTISRLSSERIEGLFGRAAHLRRINDFDGAKTEYEQILTEDPEDCEAYWGVVLCRYGIEYVKDPKTGNRIPTMHRTQITSILDDEDYHLALDYANEEQRALYKKEAEAINVIQNGILDISAREEPFDVFICYKESDSEGQRTEDSVIGYNLYRDLGLSGIKVFYARETLKDKLGSEYEPYIFSALHSAKVMVVIGTKPEYFKAVWVRNEWSRYLDIINSGKRRSFFPAFKGVNPYDMPKEFNLRQGQNLGEVGGYENLLSAIERIIGKKTTVTDNGKKLETLIKRGYDCLEFNSYNEARDFSSKIIELEYENAHAYVIKLLADLELEGIDNLPRARVDFTTMVDYKKAMKYGDDELKEKLHKYGEAIKERLSYTPVAPPPTQPTYTPTQGTIPTSVTGYDVVITSIGISKLSVVHVVKEVANLSLKEAKELVEGAPEKVVRGVSLEIANDVLNKLKNAGASAEIVQVNAPITHQASAVASFDVILTSAGTSKLNTIKVVRELTGLLLNGAKTIVEGAPSKLLSNVTQQTAEHALRELSAVGAQAQIVPLTPTGATPVVPPPTPKVVTTPAPTTVLTTPPVNNVAPPPKRTPTPVNSVPPSAPRVVTPPMPTPKAPAPTIDPSKISEATVDGNGTLVFPINTREISDECYSERNDIINVIIPEGVSKIGAGAFSAVSSLKVVEIPSTVTEIGNGAFEFCASLVSINVSSDNKHFKSVDGCLYSIDGKTLVQYPIGKRDESFKIPMGVDTIGASSFWGARYLSEIVIPSSVTLIENMAFQGCSGLAELNIPSSVRTIDDSAFYECISLERVSFGSSLKYIGENAFALCSSLKDVILPNTVESICQNAFTSCSGLVKVYIPPHVEFVGDDAFSCCEAVKDLTCPSHVIDEFSRENLERVVVNYGEMIGDFIFYQCKVLKSIELYDEITKICASAFEGCSSLKEISLPSALTSIEERAFAACSYLTYIYIPNNVSYVGKEAFAGCTKLTVSCDFKKPFLSSTPKGWDKGWNPNGCKVIWQK